MVVFWLSGGCCGVFFFKQKTAYEMRISYWSSDVCSSDLVRGARPQTPDADRFLASVDLEEGREREARADEASLFDVARGLPGNATAYSRAAGGSEAWAETIDTPLFPDRKSTRLNSSH